MVNQISFSLGDASREEEIFKISFREEHCQDIVIKETNLVNTEPILTPYLSNEGTLLSIRKTEYNDIDLIGQYNFNLKFITSAGQEDQVPIKLTIEDLTCRDQKLTIEPFTTSVYKIDISYPASEEYIDLIAKKSIKECPVQLDLSISCEQENCKPDLFLFPVNDEDGSLNYRISIKLD